LGACFKRKRRKDRKRKSFVIFLMNEFPVVFLPIKQKSFVNHSAAAAAAAVLVRVLLLQECFVNNYEKKKTCCVAALIRIRSPYFYIFSDVCCNP
jgi:dolichyl-phosphate-mannose--protein O-mannosyl transferase